MKRRYFASLVLSFLLGIFHHGMAQTLQSDRFHYRNIGVNSSATIRGESPHVGNSGISGIVRAALDGPRWELQRHFSSIAITQISTADSLSCWAIGIDSAYKWEIWKTTDGGTTWTQTQTPSGSFNLNSVCALDDQSAVVGTGGDNTFAYLIRTTDGGSSWSKVYQDSTGSSNGWQSIHFVDHSLGFAYSDPPKNDGIFLVVKTTDGGINWSPTQASPGNSSIAGVIGVPKGLWASDARHIWVSTSSAKYLFRSTDGGVSWMPSSIPGVPTSTPGAHGLAAFDSNIVLAGIWNSPSPTIYRSTDGGGTWNQVASVVADIASAVAIPGTPLAWANSYTNPERVFSTSDYGASWQEQTIQSAGDNSAYSNLSVIRQNNAVFGWLSRGNVSIEGGIYKLSGSPAPLPPQLSSPLANAVNQPVTLSFQWHPSVSANSYGIQLSTDSAFSTNVVPNDSGIVDTFKSVNGLQHNTAYYWRVNAENSTGTSPYSDKRKFLTTLAAPVLVSPAPNASGVPIRPLMQWNPVVGASSYRLEIARDSLFLNVVSIDSNISAEGNSLQVRPLEYRTTYFWRMYAQNSNGRGEVSSVSKFKTGLAGLTLAATPVNSHSIQLEWPVSAGAAFCHIFRSTTGSHFSLIDSASGNSYLDTVLNALTAYWYRITAIDSEGVEGDSSNIVSGRTYLPSPTSITVEGLSSATMQIRWTPPQGAVACRIYRSSDSTHFAFVDSAPASPYVDTNLAVHTRYWYEIMAIDTWGREGDKSAVVGGTTKLPPPSVTTTSVTSGSVRVSWNAIDDAAYYTIYRKTGGQSFVVIDTTSAIQYTDKTGINSYTVYQYEVSGTTGDRDEGDFSTISSVLTKTAAPGGLTLNALTSQRIGLKWNIAAGAVNYHIYRSGDSSHFSNSPVATPGSSYSDTTGLQPYTSYWYTVAGVDSTSREGDVCGSQSIRTKLSPPHLQIRAIDFRRLLVTWDSVPYAGKYRLLRSTDNVVYFTYDSTTALSFLDSGLTGGTRYWYKTLALTPGGEPGDTSAPSSTVTYPMKPLSLLASDVIDVRLTLSWSSGGGLAGSYRVYRNIDSTRPVSPVAAVVQTTYTDTGLTPSTRYWYWVEAINSINVGGELSDSIAVTTRSPFSKITGIATPSGTNRGDVPFAFNLIVPAKDSVHLLFSYSTDGGTTFTPTTHVTTRGAQYHSTTLDTAIWHNQMDDVRVESNACLFKVVPVSSLGRGDSAQTGPFRLDNAAPRFNGVWDGTGAENHIVLFWNRAVDLNGPITYEVDTASIAGHENDSIPCLTTTDTTCQLRNLLNFHVYYIIVRAKDSVGNLEMNTHELAVTPTAKPMMGSADMDSVDAAGTAFCSYMIRVPLQDVVHLVCLYSTDGGGRYDTARAVTGDRDSIVSTTTGQIVWRSKNDTVIESRNVQIKIIPVGKGGAGTSAVAGPFTIDSKIPLFGGLKSAVGGLNSVTLTWNPATDLSTPLKYLVYSTLLSGHEHFSVFDTAVVGDTTITVVNLQNFRQYFFIVRAQDAAGNTENNIVELMATPTGKPSISTLVPHSIYRNGDVSMVFQCNVPGGDIVGLQTFYSVDSGSSFHPANSVTGRTTGITISGPDTLTWQSRNDTIFESNRVIFRILPVGAGGAGTSTNSPAFTIDTKAPVFAGIQDLQWDIDRQAVRVSWTDASDLSRPIEYFVFVDTGWSSWQKQPVDSAATLSAMIPRLDGLKTYHCSVRARDAVGNIDNNVAELSFTFPALCDFNNDNAIDGFDLSVFAAAWQQHNLVIADVAGSAGGMPVDFRPHANGVIDFDDIALFGLMWNWSLDHGGFNAAGGTAPAPSGMNEVDNPILFTDFSAAGPDRPMQVKSSFQHLVNVQTISLEFNYDPKNVKIDSMLVNDNSGDVILRYVDNQRGRVVLAVAALDGVLDGRLSGKGFIEFRATPLNGFSDCRLNIRSRVFSPKSAEIGSYASVLKFGSETAKPKEFRLEQNYPNPFNPVTQLQYALPVDALVSVRVYDMLGCVVATLSDGYRHAGYQTVRWDGANMPSGIYFCRFEATAAADPKIHFSKIRKMALLK